jgi:hypothetical protein
MGREREMERKFSRYLDAMLAGKNVEADPTADKEMLATLDFARKLPGLCATPSPKFQARLKAALLNKLAEQEAREKEKSGFWGGLYKQPIWQAALVAVFMILIVSVMWRAGLLWPMLPSPSPMATPTTTTAPTSTATQAPTLATQFRVDAQTDKSIYRPGEAVNIEVTMKNTSAGPLTVDKYPPILSLMQSGTNQTAYTFAGGTGPRTFAAGESASYNLAWDQMDYKGRPATGSYYLELEDLENKGQAIKLNLVNPVYFEIRTDATQTGTTRTIEVNASQSSNGITVTMQRMAISDYGIGLYASVTPPGDYKAVKGISGYRATQDYTATATYSFDQGWVNEARQSSVEYLANGMNHTWTVLVAVPAGAMSSTSISPASAAGRATGNSSFPSSKRV